MTSNWPNNFENVTGAVLSSCREYRYVLWRKWSEQAQPLVFLMLNPSTADETEDDRTIKRCIHFAKREGAGGIIVGNIFALRSSAPASLYAASDPVGPENDHWVETICRNAFKVVAAWGNERITQHRIPAILSLLKSKNISLCCLKKNKNGSPRHPLYCHDGSPFIPYP